ncbi:hypothetical protein A9Q96_13790 [Rhodobacterales bacterium 52_120_T64]|nr:hypothetical protein A9Q96_13790 [Rhodobacterales bacterium 52_120_T64]
MNLENLAPTMDSNLASHVGPVVKSAERALRILEFFDGVQRSACVSEISKSLNYPQSSTSVLLRSLVYMGYLQQDSSRRSYFPTRRVGLLGNWVDPNLVQQGSLLEFVHDLSAKSGQTVVMATANGINVQYIYVCYGPDGDGPEGSVKVGDMLSIAHTAVGRALLSTYSEDRISALLRRINAEKTEGQEPIAIAEFMTEIREQKVGGYFYGNAGVPGQHGLALVLDQSEQLLVLGMEGDPVHIEGCMVTLSEKMCESKTQLSIVDNYITQRYAGAAC